MNSNGLKQLYIILGAGLLGLAAHPASAQVGVGPVDQRLDRTLDRTLDRRLPRLDDRLDSRTRENIDETAAALETAVGEGTGATPLAPLHSVGDLAANGTVLFNDTARAAAGLALRPFVADVDPLGQPIEKNVLVLLLHDRQLATARAAGLQVLSERAMLGLGLTLLTLDAGTGTAMSEHARELKRALPDAAVDYNHLYRLQQGRPGYRQSAQSPGSATGRSRIGMIDSAVKPDHPALAGRRVERHDFVTHDAGRPLSHGTAVASLLSDAAGGDVEILAASVFFQLPRHAPGASTESLVAALDWLARENVDAINMSLSGPANELLERALDAIAAAGGPPVVAAVGNNGPSGEPMYPGAYESVIGVTAVDHDDKVFRYANRGGHVDFAALGVNVKVADAGGSFRLASGTSMAAPRVTALVAALEHRHDQGRDALVAKLIDSAKDLGQRGFDPVYGHGLLAALPLIVTDVRTSPRD